MKKILVTGANGQLGSEIRNLPGGVEGFDFLFTDVDSLDVTDPYAVGAFFRAQKPSYVVNCAAYTAVDRAEKDEQAAFLLNGKAPGILADCCRSAGARLIHISTDYVFDGRSWLPYQEEDPTNPTGIYGRSKREGEINCLAASGPVIVRTSWLYSRYGANFVKTMLRLGRERETIRVVYDQVGSPTHARDLAGAILEMVARAEKTPGLWAPGIYHYANQGVCSWYDFAAAVHALAGIRCRLIPVRTAEYPTLAARPPYSVLDKSKITALYGFSIPHWMESLRDCIIMLGKDCP